MNRAAGTVLGCRWPGLGVGLVEQGRGEGVGKGGPHWAGEYMIETETRLPARQLVATNTASFPNETAEYRKARNELLVEEIELRRHIERVSAQRRALPLGGAIPRDFEFVSATGPVRLSSSFGDKDTLMVYSVMFGPARATPCPMCTSFLSSWNGTAMNLRQRCALVVTARSEIGRLVEFKRRLGFDNLPFCSDPSSDYTRAYVNPDDLDVPGFSIFSR